MSTSSTDTCQSNGLVQHRPNLHDALAKPAINTNSFAEIFSTQAIFSFVSLKFLSRMQISNKDKDMLTSTKKCCKYCHRFIISHYVITASQQNLIKFNLITLKFEP